MTTVLLVEDEEVVLILAQSALDEHGFETKTATDITSATALLDGDEPFDCLFTDINLSDGDGLELAVLFRAKFPTAAVLYTTGVVVTDGIRARMVDGAELLSKPYRIEALVDSVRRLVSAAPHSN